MSRRSLIILLALVVLFVGILVVIPSKYAVERSERIEAPPEVVFALLDVSRWSEWSPLSLRDSNVKLTPRGAGVGATLTWAGDETVGEGVLTVTESRPGEHLGLRVDYTRPPSPDHRLDIELLRSAGEAVDGGPPALPGTIVTWRQAGSNDFGTKAFALVMDCKHLIGLEAEKSLTNLKMAAQAEAAKLRAPEPEPQPEPQPEPEAADGGAASPDAGTP